MSETFDVRMVKVEILRSGPPHNQLLSPLTEYLAICGESGAAKISLPYEHATFERRLEDLRYDGATEQRLAAIQATGIDMARILAAVPGLSGALNGDSSAREQLIHLQITLSASELALLPFELSKLPTTTDASSESWLALQTRPPVCITRHIRTVPSEGVRWPVKPRISFVAGPTADIPFEEHLQALEDAIAPYQYPGTDEKKEEVRDRRWECGELLTVIKDASLDDVVTACRSAEYTHVHVLAHGAPDPSSKGGPFGLRLRARTPGSGADIVSGERFASALGAVGARIHRPSVVSIASCDLAQTGDVKYVAAGSFAHHLHQS